MASPPPEHVDLVARLEEAANHPREQRMKNIVIFMFSALLLCCVPLYWGTSRVYRAPLPALSPTPAEVPLPSIKVRLVLMSGSEEHSASLATVSDVLQHAHPLDARYDISTHVVSDDGSRRAVADANGNEAVDDALLAILEREEGIGGTRPFCLTFVFIDGEGVEGDWVVGTHRHAWTSTSSLASARSSLPLLLQRMLGRHQDGKYESVQAQPLTHYTISFSLLNAEPTTADLVDWDITEAIDRYVNPFIGRVSPICSMEVDSQVLQFADLGRSNIRKSKEKGHYYISAAKLNNFVGNTKWHVVSPLKHASLEVLVYIPKPSQQPLFVKATDGTLSTSFLVPRWGSVVVFNSHTDGAAATDGRVSADHLRTTFASVIPQLRIMLGLYPVSPFENTETQFVRPSAFGLTAWEEDGLLWRRMRDNLLRVQDTLQSLDELLERVPHMPVGEEIQVNVQGAVARYQEGLEHAQQGSYAEAMRASREAVDYSRKAFFDCSMLPSLYFPEEHVYAVYSPFFLPVVIPVISAAISALKELRRKRE